MRPLSHARSTQRTNFSCEDLRLHAREARRGEMGRADSGQVGWAAGISQPLMQAGGVGWVKGGRWGRSRPAKAGSTGLASNRI